MFTSIQPQKKEKKMVLRLAFFFDFPPKISPHTYTHTCTWRRRAPHVGRHLVAKMAY